MTISQYVDHNAYFTIQISLFGYPLSDIIMYRALPTVRNGLHPDLKVTTSI